jgi:predicted PurR-regulated permease PerM
MTNDPRHRSAWITFGILLAAALLLAALTFSPLWKPLLLAAVLSSATYNVYASVTKHFGGRRHLAASVMTVGVIVLLLVPVAVITSIAVREAGEAITYVRDALDKGGVSELAKRLPDRVEGPVRRFLSSLPFSVEQLPSQATGSGRTAARIFGDLLSAASHLVFSLVMMLIAYFSLLTDGSRLMHWIEDVSPLRGRQTLELFGEFRKVSRSVLGSTLATDTTQATVACIGYLIAGIPNAIFFAFLTFFCAFIPSVGTSIIALPLVGALFLFGQTWQAIFLAAWALLIVGLVDNVLKPLLLRGGMRLHGTVVFFSLVGGILVFGGIGILVGPLAVTFFLTMIRFAYRDFSPHPIPGQSDEVPGPGALRR